MIVAVAGPSGVGKSRMLAIAKGECGYQRPVAATTRMRRSEEMDGRDYVFLTRQEFRRRIRERAFIDWDYTIGNYYGYGAELPDIARHQAVIVAVTARVAIRLSCELDDVHLLFLNGDDSAMGERLRARGMDSHEILLRELHRAEEREHSVLFHERVADAHSQPEADVIAHLLALRADYGV